MQSWKTSKLWPGQTVFIIGGGPSVKDMDLHPLVKCRTIGVNDAFKILPSVDVTWFTDCRWYQWNAEALKAYHGLIIGSPRCTCDHARVLQLRRLDASGIATDPELVKWNKNSGASAINLAFHFGAKRVVLIGFDMRVRDEQHNWHNNHPHTPRKGIYDELFLPQFTKIARDAKQLGLEIVNATPNSALTVFPMVDLQEVL